VPENDRKPRRNLSLHDVEIRAADPARLDLDDDLLRGGKLIRQLRRAERVPLGRPDSLEEHRLHGALFCGGMKAP